MFQFSYFLLLDIFKHLYHNSIQAFPTDKRVRKKEYYFADFAEQKNNLYATVTIDNFESNLYFQTTVLMICLDYKLNLQKGW